MRDLPGSADGLESRFDTKGALDEQPSRRPLEQRQAAPRDKRPPDRLVVVHHPDAT